MRRLPHGGPALAGSFGAGLLVAMLVALAITGRSPQFRGLVPFSARGLIGASPSGVTRIEIRTAHESIALHRDSGTWVIDGTAQAAPAELASHIETGLRFMHVSEPARAIGTGELTEASFAEFGLDPPAAVVVLGGSDGTIATASFGVLNPAGTSQYVRLAGAPTVYLLPRHVGIEWQVATDMAHRLPAHAEPADANRGASLLLPVSIAQVWAVEIVAAGKLTRFERDTAGDWFRHVGQHSHAGGANAHVADPVQARIIGEALAAFDESAVESRIVQNAGEGELGKFGLTLPSLIVLLYARDASTPLARLEFGAPAGNFDRYARLAPHGDVVTVAESEAKRLTGLLKAVGAGS